MNKNVNNRSNFPLQTDRKSPVAETLRVDLPADSKINGLNLFFDFVSPEGAGAFRPTLGSSAAGACITGESAIICEQSRLTATSLIYDYATPNNG